MSLNLNFYSRRRSKAGTLLSIPSLERFLRLAILGNSATHWARAIRWR
jgi:hypothetical protein